MGYRMAFLDKRLYLAALAIQTCWKGIKARRFTSAAIAKRKWATILLQSYLKDRIEKIRLKSAQVKSCYLL